MLTTYFFKSTGPKRITWLSRVRKYAGPVLTILLLNSMSVAEDQSSERTIYSPDYVQSPRVEDTILSHDIWALLFPEGNAPKLLFQPQHRSTSNFIRDTKSCRFPASNRINVHGKLFKLDGGKYLKSASAGIITIHVFSRPGLKPPHDISELAGSRVIVPNDYTFDRSGLTNIHPITIIPVSSPKRRVKMLLGGRADYAVLIMPLALHLYGAYGIETLPFDPTLMLESASMALYCHNTPENSALIKDFNKRMERVKKDGRLKALLEQHRLDVSLHYPKGDTAE